MSTTACSVPVAINVASNGGREVLGMAINASKLETVWLGFSH